MANLERSNRRYLEVVSANREIYELVEQVGGFDALVRAGRLRSRQGHVERVAATIRHWQAGGHSDPGVDPLTTAAALVSMLSNFTYWLYVGGDPYDEDQAAATLTNIWVRAVGLRAEPTYDVESRG